VLVKFELIVTAKLNGIFGVDIFTPEIAQEEEMRLGYVLGQV